MLATQEADDPRATTKQVPKLYCKDGMDPVLKPMA